MAAPCPRTAGAAHKQPYSPGALKTVSPPAVNGLSAIPKKIRPKIRALRTAICCATVLSWLIIAGIINFKHIRSMENINRQTTILYIFINIAIIFSLALPAAGMFNHLLATGEASLIRGLIIWLSFSAACFVLTLPLIPVIRRRIHQQKLISTQKASQDAETIRNQNYSQEA